MRAGVTVVVDGRRTEIPAAFAGRAADRLGIPPRNLIRA